MPIQNHIKLRGQKDINRRSWWIDPCIWIEWTNRRYDCKCRKILNKKPFPEQQMHSPWWPEVRCLSWQEIPIWLRKVSGDQWKHEVAHSTCIFPGLLVAACVFCRSNITDSIRIWKYEGWNRTVEASYSECIKLPNDFPVPCNSLKCAIENVCQCHVKQVACCQFCKCEGVRGCRSLANIQS